MNDSIVLWEIYRAVTRLTEDVADLRAIIKTAMYWGKRGAILVTLWVVGILANLNTQEMASLMVGVLKLLVGI